MTLIRVLQPGRSTRTPGFTAAPRRAIRPGAVVTLVNNTRPRAEQLLRCLGDELQRRWPSALVELYSKQSSARPLSVDEAGRLAARTDLAVVGVGD